MADQQGDIRVGAWAVAAERISRILFRVEAGESGGSAFAISTGSGQGPSAHGLLLATAYHVIERASPEHDDIVLTSADGSVVLRNPEVEFFLYRLGPAEYDTALIMVRAKDPFFDQEFLLPLLQHDYIPAQGGGLGWMGFPSIAWPNPCFFKGVVAGRLPNSEAFLIDGVAINGVSGGPAFNREATVFGLVSAYIPNRVDEQTTLPGLMLMVPTTFIDMWVSNVLGAKEYPAA